MKNIDTINAVSLEALANYGLKRIAIAIGVFDGVHLGHQTVLRRLLAMSECCDAAPVVLTFFPHPRKILFPEEPLLMLVSNEKKFELLSNQNMKAVVTLPFCKDFASLSAEQFLEDCLYAPDIEITGICVGSKWRFGKGGNGNAETIHCYANVHNFEFDPVEEFNINGQTVSSTLIRRAVSSGLLNEAAEMLGRNYSVSGIITHGAFDGSSVLECPTANITVTDGIIPPNGVYAGHAVVDDKKYCAAISIGVSPTFADKKRRTSDIEVHLLDFKGDIYGKKLEAEFVTYIREERCYSSPEDLKKQIERDLGKVREVLKLET
jgi:riboflavin kinase/FMN adenylyltransferase